MSNDEDHIETAWTPPTADDDSGKQGGPADAGDDSGARAEPETISETVAARAQTRLGLSPQQWFVVESVLLVLPYPLFVLAYLYLPVPETAFLAATVVYSAFAVWFGFRRPSPRQS